MLGSTGKDADYGEDVCGECDGDGTSCVDCAGVPFGTKKVDLCGDCLEPTDDTFNMGRLMLDPFCSSECY